VAESIVEALLEGFHDRAKMQAVMADRGDERLRFSFYRNGKEAGEILEVRPYKDGAYLMGMAVGREFRNSGIGRAMIQFVFDNTSYTKLHLSSAAHGFYQSIGGRRKGQYDFVIDKQEFKPSSTRFVAVPQSAISSKASEHKIDSVYKRYGGKPLDTSDVVVEALLS
jgi:GNAT superfamily N-acetyltransferase